MNNQLKVCIDLFLKLMELKYNDYNESIYDKTNFIICKTENLQTNDYICINNCIYKILKIIPICDSKPKISKFFVECIGIFNNLKYSSILYIDNDNICPIINKLEYKVIAITKFTAEIFDENTNEIIEINLNFDIDISIKNQINIDDIVLVLKFKNLIKVVKIVKRFDINDTNL